MKKYLVKVVQIVMDESETLEYNVSAENDSDAIEKAMILAQDNGSTEAEYEFDSIKEV